MQRCELAIRRPGKTRLDAAALAAVADRAVVAHAVMTPFAGYGNFAFVGQTTNDSTGNGPFHAFGIGFLFGTLTLDSAQKGPFIVALASFDDYSLYLYDPKSGSVSSLEVSTFGTTNEIANPGTPSNVLTTSNTASDSIAKMRAASSGVVPSR